jgi:hypothetical protein
MGLKLPNFVFKKYFSLKKCKKHILKQGVNKNLGTKKDVYSLYKRNNIYFSFIFQDFLNDYNKKGKLTTVWKEVSKSLLKGSKEYKVTPQALNFFILEKCLVPFDTIIKKRGKGKVSISKPISLARQLTLAKKMLSNSVKDSKNNSLSQKLDWEFFGLLKNQNTNLSKYLSKRFDNNV